MLLVLVNYCLLLCMYIGLFVGLIDVFFFEYDMYFFFKFVVVVLLFNIFIWGLFWIGMCVLEGMGLYLVWVMVVIFSGCVFLLLILCYCELLLLWCYLVLLGVGLVMGLINVFFNMVVVYGDVVWVILLFYLMLVWIVILVCLVLYEVIILCLLVCVVLGLGGVFIVLY